MHYQKGCFVHSRRPAGEDAHIKAQFNIPTSGWALKWVLLTFDTDDLSGAEIDS